MSPGQRSARRSSLRRWLQWIPTAGIAVLLVVASVVCAWSWGQWRVVRSELAQGEERLVRYYQLTSQEDEISERIDAFEDYLLVSPSEDTAMQELLQLMEQTAGDTSLQITGVKPRPVQRTERVVEYQLELDCLGPMTAVVEFLHTVEHSSALLRIDRLRLNPAPRAANQLQAHILVTYTQVL